MAASLSEPVVRPYPPTTSTTVKIFLPWRALAVCTENLNSGVMVMQAAEYRPGMSFTAMDSAAYGL